MNAHTHILKQGYGFDVGQNFARAPKDIPAIIEPNQTGQNIFAFIPEDPQSPLGFMRRGINGLIRIHTRRDAFVEVAS